MVGNTESNALRSVCLWTCAGTEACGKRACVVSAHQSVCVSGMRVRDFACKLAIIAYPEVAAAAHIGIHLDVRDAVGGEPGEYAEEDEETEERSPEEADLVAEHRHHEQRVGDGGPDALVQMLNEGGYEATLAWMCATSVVACSGRLR